jgi:hypothetical protein
MIFVIGLENFSMSRENPMFHSKSTEHQRNKLFKHRETAEKVDYIRNLHQNIKNFSKYHLLQG